MMTKFALLILIIFALMTEAVGLPLGDEQISSREPAPTIVFWKKVYDAGESWEGEMISHNFVFANAGDADLKITRVWSSCGCIAQISSSDTIAPGESGEIEALLNTRGYRGRITLPVYVDSNDPENPNIRLDFQTTVKTLAAFSPEHLEFGRVSPGHPEVRKTSLVYEAEFIPIREIIVTPDYFQARIIKSEEADEETGEKARVRIEVTLAPDTPIGRHRGILTAHLDHPRPIRLSGSLSAMIGDLIQPSSPEFIFSDGPEMLPGPEFIFSDGPEMLPGKEGIIQYYPQQLFFNENELETSKTIRLVNQDEQPVTAIKATSLTKEFAVEAKTVRPGMEFEVAVRISHVERGAIFASYAGAVRIEIEHPDQDEIIIPLRAILRF